jgi:hypothetical protein
MAASTREDEAATDALLAAEAAKSMPDGVGSPSAQSRSVASGTNTPGTVPAASVEAERERVLTRMQAAALRRAEELASYRREERCTEQFADDVQGLADLVAGLTDDRQDIADTADRYLATLMPSASATDQEDKQRQSCKTGVMSTSDVTRPRTRRDARNTDGRRRRRAGMSQRPVQTRWPWAAILSLVLAVVAGVSGWATMHPASTISVEVHGSMVTKSQIEASLGNLKAYSPFTVRVCGPGQAGACAEPERGVLSITVGNAAPRTRIAKGWLHFPTGSPDRTHRTAPQMIQHAATTSYKVGQNAGQVSSAAHAAVEAQGLQLHRSPLLWGGVVNLCLVVACVRGYLHYRRRRLRARLDTTMTAAARSLATVLLDLERAELSAVELEAARTHKMSGPDPWAMVRAFESVPSRSVELTRRRADLDSRLRTEPYIAGPRTAEDVERFAEDCAQLEADLTELNMRAALLLDSPNSLDVWDRATRPLVTAEDTVRAALQRTDSLSIPSVVNTLGLLSEVKETMLAAGGRRSGDAAKGPEEISEYETSLITEQTLRVSEILTDLIRRLSRTSRLVYRPRRERPKDLRRISPVAGAAQRSAPGLEARPLVAHLAGPARHITAEGFRSWWDEVILVPDWKRRAAKRSLQGQEPDARTERMSGRARRRRKKFDALSPNARSARLTAWSQWRAMGRGARIVMAMPVVAFLCLACGFIGHAVGTSINEGRHQESTHVVGSILSERAEDWPLKQVTEDAEISWAYVPMRVIIMDLPQRESTSEQPQDLPRLDGPAGHRLTRQMVAAVGKDRPDLLDPATGDLRSDVAVIGLAEPPSDGTGQSGLGDVYHVDAWAWGPTAAPERSGGYLPAHFPGTYREEGGTITLAPVYVMDVFGTPLRTATPTAEVTVVTATVAAVVGCFTVCIWVGTTPWKAWGAGRSRRRKADASLAATRAALQAAYSHEDEAELDALLASRAAARAAASGTEGTVPDGDVEAERRRVTERTRALALRRADELAGLPKKDRSSPGFAAQVTELGDLAASLETAEQHAAHLAEKYLSTLLT